MVFPATPLGVTAEVQLAGTWTDITSYSLEEGSPLAAYAITRGRANETTAATPATCALRLNNGDGRFTIRNPTGPYYPNLTRNTPLRISVPDSGTYLRFEDDTASYISTPSSAGLNITGDLEIQLDMQPSSYMPAVLASKDDAAAQRAWSVRLNGDGTIRFAWFDSGAAAHTVNSTAPVPLGRISLRITLALASGTVTWYTSTTPISGSPSWTQLGTASVTGATSLASTTSVVAVSATPALAASSGLPGPPGKFYGFRLLTGIGGTLKASPDFTTATPGAATLADAQGNVWTLAGTAVFSNRSYRFHGELSSLPQAWDVTGHEAWTPVTAGGPLRRLQQGSAPLPSAMKASIRGWPSGPSTVSGGASAPLATLAYWPAEDPQGSTQIAAGIAVNSDGTAVRAMTLGGLPAFQGTTGSLAADSTFACSAQLPQVQSSVWGGQVPPYNPAATAWSVMFPLAIPAAGLPGSPLAVTLLNVTFGGTQQLAAEYDSANGGQLSLLFNTTRILGPTGLNGKAMWVQLVNVGTGTPTGTMNILLLGSAAALAATSVTTAAGNLTSVQVNAGNVISGIGSANTGTTLIGHIWAAAAWSSGSSAPALPVLGSAKTVSILNAWNGETAASRIGRLAAENGYQARVYGYPAVSAAMGPQPIDTLANQLQFCEDADRGQVFEPRQCLGLGYRTSRSLLNQAAAVTLSVTADEVAPPLSPVDDDQFIRNDIIVSRSGGSSAQVQVTSGPLSVNPPPAGAGDYQSSLTVYCASDSQLPDIAGWMTHVGTADQERFPSVAIDLASTDAAVQALLPAVRDADIGAYVAVTGATWAWLPPGTIAQLIWGAAEHLGDFAWDITWNTVPELPYEVAVLDDAVLGRLDTDGSTLSGWSFAVSGTPTDGTFFIVSTGQSASIFPGDTLTDTKNPGVTFRVTSLSAPFGGFVNVSVTPTAGTIMSSPDTVTQVRVSATATAISVATTNPGSPLWTTAAGDFPFDVTIAGEQITVTNITGTSSPQTFTVTRSVNGVVKAQSPGAAVALFHAPVAALV